MTLVALVLVVVLIYSSMRRSGLENMVVTGRIEARRATGASETEVLNG